MHFHSVGCGMANQTLSAMQFGYAQFYSRSHDAVTPDCSPFDIKS